MERDGLNMNDQNIVKVLKNMDVNPKTFFKTSAKYEGILKKKLMKHLRKEYLRCATFFINNKIFCGRMNWST